MPLSAIPGLVLHLPMNEKTGMVAHDNTRYGNHGAFAAGAAAPVWGEHGLRFDGADDYVDCGNDGSLNFGASMDFSVCGWFKTNDIGNIEWGIVKGRTYNNKIYGMRKDATNKLQARIYDASAGVSFYSDNAINDNIWHHFTTTADRNGLAKLYVDSDIQSANADISGLGDIDTSDSFRIGIHPTSPIQSWFGDIDDVRVYNRALRPAEIADLYAERRHLYL